MLHLASLRSQQAILFLASIVPSCTESFAERLTNTFEIRHLGLARRVHELYFNPQCEEFEPRTMWSLSNAFTSAFQELDPIPQFKATAKLREFLESRSLQ